MRLRGRAWCVACWSGMPGQPPPALTLQPTDLPASGGACPTPAQQTAPSALTELPGAGATGRSVGGVGSSGHLLLVDFSRCGSHQSPLNASGGLVKNQGPGHYCGTDSLKAGNSDNRYPGWLRAWALVLILVSTYLCALGPLT